MTEIISGKNIPLTKPAIIIRNQGLEQIFETAVNLWMRKFPEEIPLFKEDMKNHKEMKFKENAMTSGGNFMCKGLMPPKLRKLVTMLLVDNDVLDHNEAINWDKHPELINPFFNVFKMGCVNETSDLR